MKIMPMAQCHLEALAALEQACFSVPWSRAALAAELFNPQALFLVAEQGTAAVGYAGVLLAADEGMLANVAVAKECRRRGMADALLTELCAQARARGCRRLTLEVRQSNAAAQALYQKHGFAPVGRRPHYYAAPVEDAVIMGKEFAE